MSLKASYTQFDDYVEGPPTDFFKLLLGQSEQAQASGCISCARSSAALRNTLNDIGSKLIDIGFRYDATPYALWGEYFTNSARESLRSSYSGMAIGASITHGRLTPYLIYGTQKLKKINAQRISPADLSSLPPGSLLPIYNQEPFFPSNSSRQSWAIGTRYDITPNAALKAEILQVRLDDPERAYPTPFPKLSPATEPRSKSFELYTVALNFVF